MNALQVILDFIIAMEVGSKPDGGYTKDLKDLGGETKWGISKRAYPDVDIHSLARADAERLYTRDYWERLNCSEYSFPIAACLMDTGVNMGVKRAKEFHAVAKDDMDNYLNVREKFYVRIAQNNPSQSRFIKGWLGRIHALREFIEKHSG